MLAVFHNTAARIEMLLVSIPESLGLLVFGVLLVAAAVFVRRLMAKPTGVDKKGEIGDLR
jgi:hypothetical protein